jgi:hypothetical protein
MSRRRLSVRTLCRLYSRLPVGGVRRNLLPVQWLQSPPGTLSAGCPLKETLRAQTHGRTSGGWAVDGPERRT